MIEAHTSGAIDFKDYIEHQDNPMWRLKKKLILDNISNNMLWKGFMAGGLAKPESRQDLFDIFIGLFINDDPESAIENGKVNVKKLTMDTFNKLTPEQKLKLYDDIVSSLKLPKLS